MLSGIVGETVVVRRPSAVAVDRYNENVVSWSTEAVRDVLVDRPSTESIGQDRPNGSKVAYTLHFPKAYTEPLKGCRVVVRGREFAVMGDPVAYTDWNTPGRWNRPVNVEDVDG